MNIKSVVQAIVKPVQLVKFIGVKLYSTLLIYPYWYLLIIRCYYYGHFRKKAYKSARSKHSLLLASQLPPHFCGGMYRPISFLGYSEQCSWRMSAITLPVPVAKLGVAKITAAQQLLDSLPESAKIYRIKKTKLSPIAYFMPSIYGGFCNMISMLAYGLKKFVNDPPSVIIATGPDFFSFVVAYYLARAFCARLILDYRDEWVEGQRFNITPGRYDQRWEWQCLGVANAVIYATQGLMDLSKKTFPDLEQSKLHLIRNGWDKTFFEEAKKTNFERIKSNKFVITYVGTLRQYMPIDSFIETLGKLLILREDLQEKFFFRFYGDIDKENLAILNKFRQCFPRCLEIGGVVSKLDAIRLCYQSDALFLLTDLVNTRTFPGKTSEYLALGRPILVYGGTGEGEIDRVFADIGVGIMVPPAEVSYLEKGLEELISKDNRRTFNNAVLDDWLEQNTREQLSRKLFNIFDQLIGM